MGNSQSGENAEESTPTLPSSAVEPNPTAAGPDVADDGGPPVLRFQDVFDCDFGIRDRIGQGGTSEVFACRLKAGVSSPFGPLPEELCVKRYRPTVLRESPEAVRTVSGKETEGIEAGSGRRGTPHPPPHCRVPH
jgi:hypothetical protein